MKTIYLYVLDTMADWEPGYALAELQSQRYFTEKKDWQVKTCAVTKTPIVTMGGITIQPNATIDDVKADHTVMLLLPGADTWFNSEQQPILDKVRELLAADVPVAAICGATGALAQAGVLDEVQHTSNGLQYLQMFCDKYKGSDKYKEELAITDGNVITAGASAPVDFAYHILKRLQVMPEDKLEHWYGYFGKHSSVDLLKLLGVIV